MPQHLTPSAPSAAPRQAAAVDMGSGPQQPSLMEAAQALDVEMAGAYDEPVKREPVERRAVRRPPGLETSYNQPVMPATLIPDRMPGAVLTQATSARMTEAPTGRRPRPANTAARDARRTEGALQAPVREVPAGTGAGRIRPGITERSQETTTTPK